MQRRIHHSRVYRPPCESHATSVAEGYVKPGQYVQIRAPGAEKAGFFAIASAPGKEGAFEFLIKEQPPSDWSPGTGWLTGSSAGTALEMSQVSAMPGTMEGPLEATIP